MSNSKGKKRKTEEKDCDWSPKKNKQKRSFQGRRRIEYAYIEDNQKRRQCFAKRRNGLFSKSHEMSKRTGSQVFIGIVTKGTLVLNCFASKKLQMLPNYIKMNKDYKTAPKNEKLVAERRHLQYNSNQNHKGGYEVVDIDQKKHEPNQKCNLKEIDDKVETKLNDETDHEGNVQSDGNNDDFDGFGDLDEIDYTNYNLEELSDFLKKIPL